MGGRYLERFFDLRIVLPPMDLDRYFRSLKYSKYSGHTIDIICKAVIEKYHFELREIAKFLQLTKTVVYKYLNGEVMLSLSNGRALGFCMLYIIPVMIGLRLHNTQKYNLFVDGEDHLPLVEIVAQWGNRYFHNLLNSGETFDEKEDGKTLVTLDGKLKVIYDAIFTTETNESNNCVMIGDMEFNSALKGELIRISGMLSPFAKVNIE